MNKRTQIKSLKKITLEILWWTMCDLTTDEIAFKVHVAQSTVNKHLKEMYDEFGIEGEGGEKRENLINAYQKEVFALYPTEEEMKKHIRIVPRTLIARIDPISGCYLIAIPPDAILSELDDYKIIIDPTPWDGPTS